MTDARRDPPRPARGCETPDRDSSGDRALSDLVGYVLTVSILLLGVGVVSTVGVDVIDRAQGIQSAQSVESGMLLLDANVDEVVESRAEVRTTTLSLATGQVGIVTGSAPSTVTVNVSGIGDTPTTYDVGTITYRLEDATLAYEGGGVFKNETRGNAILRAEPTFHCSADRAVVSIVTFQGSAAGRGLGGATAGISTRENASRVLFPINRTGPDSIGQSTGVNVTIDSAYEDAWRDHFLSDDQAWVEDPATDDKYRCEATAGSTMPVYVRQSVLNVSVGR